MWYKSKVKLKRSILQETIIIILEIAILDEYIRQVFFFKICVVLQYYDSLGVLFSQHH